MMHFQELTARKEVEDLIKEYNSASSEYVVLDTETTGLNKRTDRVISIALTSSGSGKAYTFDSAYIEELKNLKKPVVAHNFKFDFHLCARHGVDLRACDLAYDTIILDHLLDENNSHALDEIVKRRYNDNYKELFWSKYERFEDAPREEQVSYACKDVLYTDAICRDTLRDLAAINVPKSLIWHVNKLALTLYDTELNGINVDLPYVSGIGEALSVKIRDLKEKMRSLVPLECELVELDLYEKELSKYKTPKGRANAKRLGFNFDSSSQLGSLLYDHLKLPVQLNKKRNRTVDDDALSKLEDQHAIIPLLREYRGHQKVFTAFIEGTLEKVDQGKIYPNFNPTGTVTGRISSSEPNLQQLPSTGGIRGIYVPKEGYKFVSADYKQLEVTLAAHFSRDTNLLKIVLGEASQHDITAESLGITRTTAKSINFALQYGAGVKKIQKILGCSEMEAQTAYDRYWRTYAGLRRFIDKCHLLIDQGRPIINPFGRQRHFPKKFANHWEKEHAKRQAPNALIQSTGSDCCSWSAYTVNELLKSKDLGKVLFSVHDELLCEIRSDKVEEAREIISTTMVKIGEIINLTVPLAVDVSQGMSRWED